MCNRNEYKRLFWISLRNEIVVLILSSALFAHRKKKVHLISTVWWNHSIEQLYFGSVTWFWFVFL